MRAEVTEKCLRSDVINLAIIYIHFLNLIHFHFFIVGIAVGMLYSKGYILIEAVFLCILLNIWGY